MYAEVAVGRGEDGAEGAHGHQADLVQGGERVLPGEKEAFKTRTKRTVA